MTVNEFRQLALSFPETAESAHMGHPDFRVGKKIFATLGYPDTRHGMVKLTPVQRSELIAAEPEVFQAVQGGWGRTGATTVYLPAAREGIVHQALLAAWRNTAPKRVARQLQDE